MNAHLKASMESAERNLPESGQELLVQMVDAFTANFGREAAMDFSAEELNEIRRIDAETFEDAAPNQVDAIFARHAK